MAMSTLQFRFAGICRGSFVRKLAVLSSSTHSSSNKPYGPLFRDDSSPCISNKSLPFAYNQQIFCRGYCSDSPNVSNPPKRSLPQLMPFSELVWPSVFKTIKNWILVNFIIRPYFDREFNVPDFVAGTKQALQVVSTKLADGDIALLNGLVASEILSEVKTSVSKMSVAQRSELRVNKDDIYLSFPYQIGIMIDESNEKIQKRWVEITMVFHVLRGLKEMQKRGETPPLNIGMMPEYRDKMSICNYRFIKEYTQGVESEWTINIVNHFKPSDYINE